MSDLTRIGQMKCRQAHSPKESQAVREEQEYTKLPL